MFYQLYFLTMRMAVKYDIDSGRKLYLAIVDYNMASIGAILMDKTYEDRVAIMFPLQSWSEKTAVFNSKGG